jgi:outer membrane immunogenic protein
MKKILMVSVGFAALGMAPAVAADLAPRMYTKAPPAAVAPIYNWTGFYAGAMGGFGKEDTGGRDAAAIGAISGGFGGGTVGYNWQIDRYVFGIEADAAAADVSTSVTGFDSDTGRNVSLESKLRSLGTFRGRVGVTFDQVLLYGTGGFAWANQRFSASEAGDSISDSKFRTGWAAGAGMEVMFAPHWSMKAEYLYRSLGNQAFFSGTEGAVDLGKLNIHTGQVGVNYHF